MSTDWSANFASAGLDAMTAYDEILVPRMFDDWAEMLLDGVGVAPGAAVDMEYEGACCPSRGRLSFRSCGGDATAGGSRRTC